MATSDSLERALQAAAHEDSSVRQRAAPYLGTHADNSVARELVSLLISEPDFYVRETLTWAVVTRADATYPLLVDALQDTVRERVQGLAERLAEAADPSVRSHAAEVLVGIGDPDARPAADALLHASAHDDKQVVVPAMEALATLDVPGVDETLTRLREGEDQWLSITAGWLLEDRARG